MLWKWYVGAHLCLEVWNGFKIGDDFLWLAVTCGISFHPLLGAIELFRQILQFTASLTKICDLDHLILPRSVCLHLIASPFRSRSLRRNVGRIVCFAFARWALHRFWWITWIVFHRWFTVTARCLIANNRLFVRWDASLPCAGNCCRFCLLNIETFFLLNNSNCNFCFRFNTYIANHSVQYCSSACRNWRGNLTRCSYGRRLLYLSSRTVHCFIIRLFLHLFRLLLRSNEILTGCVDVFFFENKSFTDCHVCSDDGQYFHLIKYSSCACSSRRDSRISSIAWSCCLLVIFEYQIDKYFFMLITHCVKGTPEMICAPVTASTSCQSNTLLVIPTQTPSVSSKLIYIVISLSNICERQQNPSRYGCAHSSKLSRCCGDIGLEISFKLWRHHCIKTSVIW